MRALKIMLAYNGIESVLRGVVNLAVPTLFYLPKDAPGYAQDAVRVLAITYLALGVIQLGAWRMQERWAVRVIASASLLFAAGVAVQAATQVSGSTDAFHEAGVVLGPVVLPNVGINVLVTAIYAILLLRESRMATAAGRRVDARRAPAEVMGR